MKRVAPALFFTLFLPLLGQAQSVLNFPRGMAPADFSTTGFAIVNPGPADAAVNFTLYGVDGKSQGSFSLTIPKRGQTSKLGSDLFPGVQTSGWVRAISSTPGLQGFWLGGNFATFMDGAEAAPSASELVVPLMGPQSEIDVANTSGADIVVVLHLLGTDGGDLGVAPYPQKIPANGFFKSDVQQIFSPIADFSIATHMRIECKCSNANPFAATLIARGIFAGPEWAVVNGVPASSTNQTINFPHIVDGPQGTSANWKSLIGLTNLSSSSSNDVTITFMSPAGAPIGTSVQQTLPANGGLRVSAHEPRDQFSARHRSAQVEVADGFRKSLLNRP